MSWRDAEDDPPTECGPYLVVAWVDGVGSERERAICLWTRHRRSRFVRPRWALTWGEFVVTHWQELPEFPPLPPGWEEEGEGPCPGGR